MSKRSAKFVPAVLAGIVAATCLAPLTDIRAHAATESCLSAPKAATPAGSHWFYRIDHATKRQCWYLRDADDGLGRATPPDSSPAPSSAEADPAPPQPRTALRKSIADARAEWISQQPRTEQNSAANAAPRTARAIAAPNVWDDRRAMGVNVLAPTPLARTRWPDISGASPNDLRTAAAVSPADQPQQITEPQQPAAAPVAPVAAEPAKPTASLQKLFLVMAAALALAGITVSLVVRIGRIRARRAVRRKRRAMWDSARTRRSPQPMFHDEEAALWRTEGGHNREALHNREAVHNRRVPEDRGRVPEDRERQVTEMLARLARSAQG